MEGFGSNDKNARKPIPKKIASLQKKKLMSNALKLHSSGNINEASKIYNFLIKNEFYDPRIFNNLGSIYSQIKQFDKAILLFNESIKKFPNSMEAYSNLASVLVIKGKRDIAIKILNKAIKLNPKYVKPYSNLAGIFVAEGNYEKAEFLLRKSLAINPRVCSIRKVVWGCIDF